MPSLPSRTSVKLIGGFLAILLVFFWAAFLTLRSVENVERSNVKMEKITEGVRAGRMMTDIVRDQYIQLAQFVISRDWNYVVEFQNLSRRMAPLKKRVAAQNIWTEEEKGILAQLNEKHRQFEDVFETELSQAVYENDIDKVHRIRQQSYSLMQEVVARNANLDLVFQHKLALARARQVEVAAWAKKAPFMFFGVAVVLSLLIVVYLGHSIADPIRKLIRGTQEIARGDLNAKIHLKRRDEFGRLADSFNRMTEELREHQQRIIQSEKMASLGQLAAGVAHEINNPIAVILGYIKLLLADMKAGDPYYDELKAIEEEARQCQRIVSELRNFSRPTELAIETVDAREVAEEALNRVERAGQEEGPRIVVAKDFGEAPQLVAADRGKLREVLLNIVQNAADAMPKGGQIKVAIRREKGDAPLKDVKRCVPLFRAPARPHAAQEGADPERGDVVLIEIADTGCGIPEKNMKRLFDPFFSTKERGMGLGLAISYAIVKAHKGFIRVQSEPGKSTTFTIGIPAAENASPAAPAKKTPAAQEEHVSHDP